MLSLRSMLASFILFPTLIWGSVTQLTLTPLAGDQGCPNCTVQQMDAIVSVGDVDADGQVEWLSWWRSAGRVSLLKRVGTSLVVQENWTITKGSGITSFDGAFAFLGLDDVGQLVVALVQKNATDGMWVSAVSLALGNGSTNPPSVIQQYSGSQPSLAALGAVSDGTVLLASSAVFSTSMADINSACTGPNAYCISRNTATISRIDLNGPTAQVGSISLDAPGAYAAGMRQFGIDPNQSWVTSSSSADIENYISLVRSVGDVDANEVPDVLLGEQIFRLQFDATSGTLSLGARGACFSFEINGSPASACGTHPWATTPPAQANVYPIALGDLDNDGSPEFLLPALNSLLAYPVCSLPNVTEAAGYAYARCAPLPDLLPAYDSWPSSYQLEYGDNGDIALGQQVAGSQLRQFVLRLRSSGVFQLFLFDLDDSAIKQAILDFDVSDAWSITQPANYAYANPVTLVASPGGNGMGFQMDRIGNENVLSSMIANSPIGPLWSASDGPKRASIDLTNLGAGNHNYVGNLQVSAESQSSGAGSMWLGQFEFSLPLGIGETHRLYFPIPDALQSMLAGRTDVTLTLTLSVGSWIVNPWDGYHIFFDHLRFDNDPASAGLTAVSCSGYNYWPANDDDATAFDAGTRIVFDRSLYECRAGATAPWCKQAVYKPGSTYWEQAWDKIHTCQ